MEKATELEYLQWFYANCDFGPADEDVRYHLNQSFVEESGKALPIGYESES
ncbi:hypothetical protein [Comamonas sp.]|uniref:hypothetical protein n=1 Tax=Comamonas sp. TaxID=34028 RepID=UPI003D12C00D